MQNRIGIYICECGPNIKDAMDLDDLVMFSRRLENVVLVKTYGVLCAEDGKMLMANDIRAHHLSRIVVAACSPKEHEKTFEEVLRNAGLNPCLLQMANIREQCSWIIKDKALCTDKAKEMIRAAVERVVYHEPLETREIECQPDVLVVGAGITGISAALTLSQKNRKVYLVEKLPFIGGKAARYEEVFPHMECASCLFDPIFDEVIHDERIEVLTLSQVEDVSGFYGNFLIKIRQFARFVDMKSCIGCGACLEVCPVNVKNEYNEGLDLRKAIYIPFAGILPNVPAIDKNHCIHFNGNECSACQQVCPFESIILDEADQLKEINVGAIVLATGFELFDPKRAPQYGYSNIDNVYTSLEFERLLSSNGPTGGKIVLNNGQPPQKIALVHCVGSRTGKFNKYCSGLCCSYSLKFAHLIRRHLPDVSIAELYTDFCLPGKEAQHFLKKLTGVEFHCMKAPDLIEINERKGEIVITYTNGIGETETVISDMVVLACALQGSGDARDLVKLFGLSHDESMFFNESNTKLAPLSTHTDGIYIAGCAQTPSDIQESVIQGKAAAGQILSRLIPGEKLTLEVKTATVDETLCSGCSLCIALCPYKAISKTQNEKQITINEALCRGCGSCAVVCPSAAIKSRHFTDEQINAEIKGIVHASI